MKTKEKIIREAIPLFNEKGVNGVTIRDIAGSMGISSGNFAYHFRNKEALLSYFYENMYNEVDLDPSPQPEHRLSRLQEVLDYVIPFIKKYQFFYRDLIDIIRLCPEIGEDYARNHEHRKSIYIGIFKDLSAKGILVDPADPEVFDRIAHNIWFTLTFWQSQKRVLPADTPEVQADFIRHQIWQMLIPYFTDVGKSEYEALMAPP